MGTTEHHPDPAFVARLEADLTARYRRLERLGAFGKRRLDVARWLRAAGFTFAGLLLGAASVTMAQRIDETGMLELVRNDAEARASIAARRVDLNRQLLEGQLRDYEIGLVSDAMIAPLRNELSDAEQSLAQARLELEEIEGARRAARPEISAPLVGERDFVTERLQIELDSIAARTAVTDQLIAFTETRVNAGVAVPGGLRPLHAERAGMEANAARVRESLVLRQRFLSGEIDASEAELSHRLLLATTRRQIASTDLDSLRAEEERISELRSAGVIVDSATNAFAQALLRSEAELQTAQFEVDLMTQLLTAARSE